MARYDVHPFEGGFVVDVQAEIIDMFETRTVIPLLPKTSVPSALPRLHPVLSITGSDYTLATQFISAIPKSELKKPVANLSAERDRIVAALDMLFHGF